MTSSTSLPHRLVVLDVDSTLIENEVIELLAANAGSEEIVADITRRAMRGELDFEQSLRSRVRTLAGLPDTVFEDVRSQIEVTAGVRQLIDGVHARGGRVGAVSGGFHEVLDVLAEDLGLDYWRANRLEVADGRLTGDLVGRVIDAQAKANALSEWATQMDLDLSQTIAIGDGANDLTMMAIAGLSVAFDAKPVVVEAADISLTRRDLSVVLDFLVV